MSRDRFPSPSGGGPGGGRNTDKGRTNRLGALRFRPCHPGNRDADVGPQQLPNAARHGRGRLLADGAIAAQRRFGHAQLVPLYLIRVTDHATQEVRGTARYVRQGRAQHAAGARLRHRNRLAEHDQPLPYLLGQRVDLGIGRHRSPVVDELEWDLRLARFESLDHLLEQVFLPARYSDGVALDARLHLGGDLLDLLDQVARQLIVDALLQLERLPYIAL